MKETVQDAKIPWEHSIIAAVTDKDIKIDKILPPVNIGYRFMYIGGFLIVATIFIIIYSFIALTHFKNILHSFGQGYPGIGLGNLFFTGIGVLLSIALGVFLILFGLKSIHKKKHWYLVLYPDRFLFKYPYHDVMKEAILPFTAVQKCYIISSRRGMYYRYPTKPRMRFEFAVNIHIELLTTAGIQYISMPLAKRYKEMNKIFSYIQDEKNIPVYFNPEKLTLKECRLPFEDLDKGAFQQIDFNGDLHSWIKLKQ